MFGFILQYIFFKCWKFKGGIGWTTKKIFQKNPREQGQTWRTDDWQKGAN